MAKKVKKDEKDVELITLIKEKEFISLLPWNTEKEITPIHVADLAKEVLRGKTKYRIASNARCIKHLMAALEEHYAGKLFEIRMSGSDHFWSLINPELLSSMTPSPVKKDVKAETTPILSPTPTIEESNTETEEVEVVKDDEPKEEVQEPKKPVKPLVPEDYIKAYFLFALTIPNPIRSTEVKAFCNYKGWGKIYNTVNRVLSEGGIDAKVDTSTRYWVILEGDIADVKILMDIIKDTYDIPKDVEEYISTLKLPNDEETEEVEVATDEVTSETPNSEVIDSVRGVHVRLLTQKILGSNGLFRSEINRIIRENSLSIPLPPDEFLATDFTIKPKRNPVLGRNEDFFSPSPELISRIKEEEKARIEYIPVSFHTNKELELDGFLQYEEELILPKLGIRQIIIKIDVRTKIEILNFLKLYYTNRDNIEVSGDTNEILADLETRLIS